MMRFIISFLCLSFFSFWGHGQSTLYPIAKNGKWGLIDREGTIKLAPQYDYISFSDLGQKFIYSAENKNGILNLDGSVFSAPIYSDVYFLAENCMMVEDSLEYRLYHDNQLIIEDFFKTAEVYSRTMSFLFVNTNEKRLYDPEHRSLSDSAYVDIEYIGDYLLAEKQTGKFDLLKKDDLTIMFNDYNYIDWYWWYHGTIHSDQGVQLIDRRKAQFISRLYTTLEHQFNDWYLCSLDDQFYLFNKRTQEEFKINQIDEVIDIKGSKMIYKKDGLSGIINYKTGKELFPEKYPGLALDGSTVFIQSGNNVGIGKIGGKVIIDPVYQEISNYDNLYVVRENRFYGIVSLSGKLIEKPAYTDIQVFDKNVKCYRRKTLTTLNVSQTGEIKDKTIYDSYMKVSFTQARKPRSVSSFVNFDGPNSDDRSRDDRKANEKGWYRREMQRQKGDTVETVYGSWGLKNEEDSLLIKYQYRHIEFINDHYTIGYRKPPLKTISNDRATSKARSKGYFYEITYTPKNSRIAQTVPVYTVGRFQIIDQKNKRKLYPKNSYLAFQFEDWKNNALARAFCKNPCLVDSAGYIQFDSLTYVSSYQDNMLRVCKGGTSVLTKMKKHPKALEIRSHFNNIGFRYGRNRREFHHYVIKGGHWFFIDSAGIRKNEKPFSFAHDFHNNLAIVQMGKKWGVVDTGMNVVVPIAFDKVEEIEVDDQSFFIVENKDRRNFIYSKSTGSYSKGSSEKPEYLGSNCMLVKEEKRGGKFGLLDTNMNILYPYEIDQIVGQHKDWIIAQIQDKQHLLNQKGQVLKEDLGGTSITYLGFGKYKVSKSKSNFKIVDKSGATLIPNYECYQILDMNENEITYLNSNLEFKYWSATNQQVQVPKKMILLDFNLKTRYALLQKGKKWQFIYNTTNNSFIGEKMTGVARLENEGFLFKNENGKLGMISYNNSDTIFKPTYEALPFQGKDWCLAKINYNTYGLVNRSGERIHDSLFSKVVVKKGAYHVTTKNGFHNILDEFGQIMFDYSDEAIHQENNLYYRVHIGSEYHYYHPNLELWTKNENIIEPHLGDTYKAGKKTYLNRNTRMAQGYAYARKISKDKFVIPQEKLCGVYNSQGDTIVPLKYHSITLKQEMFGTQFFNNYGQIDMEGIVHYEARPSEH